MVRSILKPLFLVLAVVVAAAALLTSCNSSGSNAVGPSVQSTGSMTIMAQRDTDGDGVIDVLDQDDDNDGIRDDMDSDDDNDGTPDDEEADHDGDGTIDDHDDDCAEVEGTISSIDGSSLVVYNVTIHVDPATTRIEGDNDQVLTLEDLAVGMRVEAEGVLNADNSIDAYEIEVEDEDDGSSDHDDSHS